MNSGEYLTVEKQSSSKAGLGRRLLWPSFLLASLYVYRSLVETVGLSFEMALQVHFVILFGGLLVIELVMPYYKAWNVYDRQAPNDLIYNFLFTGANVIAASAAVWFAGWINIGENGGLFTYFSGLPFVIQVIIFALMADLIYYVYHRSFHSWDRLWKFHSIHHSSLQLHILNNARVHPLEVFIAFFPILVFAYLVQVPVDVLSWFLVLQLTVGLLTHSNAAASNGWLSYIFNTPELHHWHHSPNIEEQNNNYGSTFIIWDQVFGTYYNPRDRRASENIGTVTAVPPGLIKQLCFPFTKRTDP